MPEIGSVLTPSLDPSVFWKFVNSDGYISTMAVLPAANELVASICSCVVASD